MVNLLHNERWSISIEKVDVSTPHGESFTYRFGDKSYGKLVVSTPHGESFTNDNNNNNNRNTV